MEIILYLKKPDLKQECLSQWQKNYNAIPSNMRNETVMIAEQHQRVDVSFICMHICYKYMHACIYIHIGGCAIVHAYVCLC